MAEWINIDLGRYLTVPIINGIYNDFLYISEKMTEAGFELPDLEDNRVTYSISQTEILDIFNSIESNINTLHKFVNYRDTYYSAPFEWSVNTDMGKYLQSGVKRWVNWLNDAKRHYDGEYETVCLTDIHGRNITDINGNQILVFKEW